MSGTPGATPQLPLSLRYPPDQRLESFIDAPPGAIAQLRALAREPGADWLYVEGGPGTGKTHLGLAVCAEAEQAGRRAAYLPLRAAAGRLGDALEALDRADVVALDGLDAVAGHRTDEVALFDFHNRARAGGRGVVYLAAAPPAALPLALPDLRSRLGQCARVVLGPLDDDGRRVLLQLAPAGQAVIDEVMPDSRRVYADIDARFGTQRVDALLDMLEELAALKLDGKAGGEE